jgi:antitoxin component YwqK of YwqJK toxin-antitoxin module
MITNDNSKYIYENLDNSIEKLIIDSFEKELILQKYNLEENEVDIKYWYEIILDRVRIDKELSEILKEKKSEEEKTASNIWGHADEYGKKHINENLEFKKRISMMRIISYGHIYSSLLKYEKNISNDSFENYLKIENINNNEYQKDIKLRVLHAKASVYGTIKFALMSNLQASEIKEWFPLFDFDTKLIEGINPLEEGIKSLTENDSEVANKLKRILEGDKRIQIYELDIDKRKDIPSWFNGPMFDKGGVVKSIITNKEFDLNYIEKSVFVEIQYNTVIIEETSRQGLSRESWDSNPHFKYMVDVVDFGTSWFERTNTPAYNRLFNNNWNEANDQLFEDSSEINKKETVIKKRVKNNFCGECGASVTKTKFCGECGKALPETVVEKKKTQNKFDQDNSEEQLNKRLNSISEDWCKILNSRASWRTMSIKTLSYSYWDMAIGHTEEYMLKYEEGQIDVEGINYRIEVLNSFINEYEKYFKACIDSKTKINDDINNRFLSVVESLIGAELTLVKMFGKGETLDLSKIYERLDKPNSETIKDVNQSNTDLVDIVEYSYYKGCIFNGCCNDYNENDLLLQETPFRYGLKHGEAIVYNENGNIKQQLQYFNDKLLERYDFDSEGKKLIEEENNTKNENSELSLSKDSDEVSDNKFLKNIEKLEAFSNFTGIQIRNTQLTVFCSAVWQLINADGKVTNEESSQFVEFCFEMSKQYLGNDEDKNDPVIAELIQDPDKVIIILKTFSEEELETFWSTLFSFALADGEFSFEEANFIGVIVGNVYEDLSDDEVRNWITEKIKKLN